MTDDITVSRYDLSDNNKEKYFMSRILVDDVYVDETNARK